MKAYHHENVSSWKRIKVRQAAKLYPVALMAHNNKWQLNNTKKLRAHQTAGEKTENKTDLMMRHLAWKIITDLEI